MKITTKCVHGGKPNPDTTGAISFPIYQSSTFAHPGVGQSTGYDYSRVQNPTREHLEGLLATLEEGTAALAFSTGMAAEAAIMQLFSQNDHIIASDDLYGGSVRLFQHIQKNGISTTLVDTADLNSVEQAITPHTKAIFVETPTNPMMQVTDIAAIAKLAHSINALLIVDNTFLTPYFQRPLGLGADIVIHSGTKYLGGHNDTLAGFLVIKSPELAEELRIIHKTTGACLSPFDSWLMLRGIKTLALRLEKQNASAQEIAQWLQANPKIKTVHYCGLPTHPGYEISRKQSSGFGGMISFETDCENTARAALERVKLIQFAESLGGVESLLTYPFMQTHADVPEEHRQKKGINERLLRLSVGIEDTDDLIADLAQALH